MVNTISDTMIFKEKEIEAVIFDMDGTMFDTERLRMQMLKQASTELFGIEMPDKLLFNSLGVSAVTGERLAKKSMGDHFPYKEVRDYADELERTTIRDNGVPVKPGLYNVLERLKKSEVLLALATSSKREIAIEYLIKAKVLRYFDIIVCGDEITYGKPAPDIFLKAASELGCDPDKCLIIEDSNNGLTAAKDAGGLPIFIRDIKNANDDLKEHLFVSYNSMREFRDELTLYTQKSKMPRIRDSFPQNSDYEIVGIHGLGAIGGGYLAQVFSHWDGYSKPQKIIGSTRSKDLLCIINLFGKYRIKYESIAYFEAIDHVEVINQNSIDKMIDMYLQSELIALTLPENAIENESKTIAKAIKKRYESNCDPLAIIVVMNRLNATEFVRDHVINELKLILPPEEVNPALANISWIETVVNRMVTNYDKELMLSKIKLDLESVSSKIEATKADFSNILSKMANGFSDLEETDKIDSLKKVNSGKSLSEMVDFVQEMSEISLTLFSAEPDMPLYVQAGNPTVDKLCQIVAVQDICFLQEIKNRLSNGTHAIIGWYSWLLGYESIGQGMSDEKVEKLARQVMEKEIRPALIKENSAFKKYIDSFISNFSKRCRVSFKDSCTRVGRDPLRKLQNDERLFGAIKMCKENSCSTDALEFGVACAIAYSMKAIDIDDHEAVMVRDLMKRTGHVSDVLTYDGPYNDDFYKGLTLKDDLDLIERINDKYKQLMYNLQ